MKKLKSTIAVNGSEIRERDDGFEDTFTMSTPYLVINEVFLPIVTVIGVVLNILGIVFLAWGPRKGQVYSLLLSTLLVFDTIFLSSEMAMKIEDHFQLAPTEYQATYQLVLAFGISWSNISSILMIVAIAHARMIAITDPFRRNNITLAWREKRTIWIKYCIPIIIISIALALPVLLEHKFPNGNPGKTVPNIHPSSIRLNAIYSILYTGVLNFGILGVLPTAYLLYALCRIRIELTKNDENLDRFHVLRNTRMSIQLETLEEEHSSFYSTSNSNEPRKTYSEQEIKISRAMVKGVLVFLSLHVFRIITTFGELYVLLNQNKDNQAIRKMHEIPPKELWIEVTAYLSEVGMVMHSSLGVIMYLSPDLRILVEMFRPRAPMFLRHFFVTRRLNTDLNMDNAKLNSENIAISLITPNSIILPIDNEEIDFRGRGVVDTKVNGGSCEDEYFSNIAIVDGEMDIRRRSIIDTKGTAGSSKDQDRKNLKIPDTLSTRRHTTGDGEMDIRRRSIVDTKGTARSRKDQDTRNPKISETSSPRRHTSFDGEMDIRRCSIVDSKGPAGSRKNQDWRNPKNPDTSTTQRYSSIGGKGTHGSLKDKNKERLAVAGKIIHDRRTSSNESTGSRSDEYLNDLAVADIVINIYRD